MYLQGTGSAGATVRIYVEQFEPDVSRHDMDAQMALKPLIGLCDAFFADVLLRCSSITILTNDIIDNVSELALSVSKLKEFTGREKPTVIT